MPEGSVHASLLIATSYQALHRTINATNSDTLITDCTVLVLFAGFYVEATLNYIFEETNTIEALKNFPMNKKNCNGKNNPGLLDKLLWFDNYFDNQMEITYWNDFRNSTLKNKLFEKYPGFKELYNFRNDICHGEINQSAKSLEIAKRLREQAKEIVNQLYVITREKGYSLDQSWTYPDALRSLEIPVTKALSPNSSS